MTTSVLLYDQSNVLTTARWSKLSSSSVYPVTILTAVALAVHGYHPYAEDGGIYLAGIKRLLNPHLYPYWSGWVTAHLHLSLFAYMVATIVRHLPMDLMATMLLLYMGSIWLTLFAGWQLLKRFEPSLTALYGGVSLLALWLTIPVAGTSLMLMDPYVTSRSFSTPCALFSLVGALDVRADLRSSGTISWQSARNCLGSLLVAALIHPLMAAYASGLVLLLLADFLGNVRLRVAVMGLLSAVMFGFGACLSLLTSPATQEYAYVARTRTYWFVGCWSWYEQIGLIGPLCVFAAFCIARSAPRYDPIKSLARVSIVAGLTAIAVAAIFARDNSPTYIVARLQPLRIFQVLYALMILFLGGWAGKTILRRKTYRWLAMFFVFGSVMYTTQRGTYPNSAHLELPWRTPENGWEQAFIWIKEHTPRDAKFAMDARYVTLRGEDSQNFRAVAERSMLPDYSKDGGVTAISPDLVTDWTNGQRAQSNLESEDDAQRKSKLGSEVDFIVLSSNANTSLKCVYRNETAKVCYLGT